MLPTNPATGLYAIVHGSARSDSNVARTDVPAPTNFWSPGHASAEALDPQVNGVGTCPGGWTERASAREEQGGRANFGGWIATPADAEPGRGGNDARYAIWGGRLAHMAVPGRVRTAKSLVPTKGPETDATGCTGPGVEDSTRHALGGPRRKSGIQYRRAT